MTQNGYRIDWTRFVPGGYHSKESSFVRGDLETVRSYLDAQCVYGKEPIIVTEFTQSDQASGRVVPASEWDICE
ncbi:MAG: hypothetical protein V4515_14580 [Chloroflexota bacterium]